MRNKSNEPHYLNKTVDAITKITLKNATNIITVKKIRQTLGVESSDLSAIRFHSLALRYLTKIGVLELTNNGSPNKYSLNDGKRLKSLVKNEP